MDKQIREEITILETHRRSSKLDFRFIAIHAKNLTQLAVFAMEKLKNNVQLPRRGQAKPDPLFIGPLPKPAKVD